MSLIKDIQTLEPGNEVLLFELDGSISEPTCSGSTGMRFRTRPRS